MAHSFSLRAVVRVASVVAEHDINLNADEPEDGRVGELARKTRGLVDFQFLNGPEWVTIGERVLITDSSGARVVGKVVKLDEWYSPDQCFEAAESVEEFVQRVEELKV
jgi:hypothetical protein